MKTWQEQGGGAYPLQGGDADRYDTDPGMSLRDYFAAKAMQEFIAPCANYARHEGQTYIKHVATLAYEMADAMLSERAK